jgi:hypothetical protein
MMKSLADEFLTLAPEKRRIVHLAVCEHALQVWNLYGNTHKRIQYTESIAGTRQEVDKQLPVDAFEAAKQGVDSENIKNRYVEPIVAMEDDDLVFPDNIQFAYYALYNLFNKYAQGETVDDWLIVNKALSSEDDSKKWDALLTHAIQKAA